MKFLVSLNPTLTICSTLLLSIAILVIYSSSKQLAAFQLLFALGGIAAYFFISRFDYRSIRNLTVLLYFVVLALLLVAAILGFETRGSVRWIPLGVINLQPSELAKPVLILLLADFWSKNLPSWSNIAKSLFWTIPPAVLIFNQPDLGSTLTLLAIWLGMLFASKVSPKKIALLVFVVVLIIPVGWFSLRDYQKERLIGFLDPHSDPLGRGYNVIQSTIAVGSGEIFGRGLGRGTQSRLQFLPEFRTDFIFASIAEEMGFVGSLLILVIYLVLIVYCLKVAAQSSDAFGFLLVTGAVSMLWFQVVVNIGMNIGLVPITGITLPLISYGGNSLVATMIVLGLVASVARYKRKIDSQSYSE
ncbi:rod shape-determining protein RodA [Candidatus Daviesbacteria bacterium]|nr:rod shape-determining protein RodA [Candidatus Daviesbacteria bacterium]